MEKQHSYEVPIKWTDSNNTCRNNHTVHDTELEVEGLEEIPIPGSSEPTFSGHRLRQNPEELFVASISSCYMLWFLHLCEDNGVIIVEYKDNATGTIIKSANSGGFFKEVLLTPRVTLMVESMIKLAESLHQEAIGVCFIAQSCNFPIHYQPIFDTGM